MTTGDQERAIHTGAASQRLLADADFLSVVNDISDYHLRALVTTPPGEATRLERDQHHLSIFALKDIVGEMQRRVVAMEVILEELSPETNHEDDDI